MVAAFAAAPRCPRRRSPELSACCDLSIRSCYPAIPFPRPANCLAHAPCWRRQRLRLSLAPWTPAFGYGRPDAAAAARSMLGEVASHTVKNRVTPLFRFHSLAANDYLDTTSPQFAIAALVNPAGAYLPQGTSVPGYDSFPGILSPPMAAPKAAVYVMTTEFAPWPGLPELAPLYMVERSRNFPLGCIPGAAGCNSGNRDFTLLTTTQEIETAHADGYSLRTIQGYVYEPCSPEPACIPPGAQSSIEPAKQPWTIAQLFWKASEARLNRRDMSRHTLRAAN
jgi:hypothetical protein